MNVDLHRPTMSCVYHEQEQSIFIVFIVTIFIIIMWHSEHSIQFHNHKIYLCVISPFVPIANMYPITFICYTQRLVAIDIVFVVSRVRVCVCAAVSGE